jgi:peptidoglycan hydrolase-like protein with peptidoglycan-binding domain
MHRFFVPLLVSLLAVAGLVVMDGNFRSSQGQAPVTPAQTPSQEQIKRAQERLKAAGLEPGSIDGVLGPQTVAALREYQRNQGLPVTGTLDDATRTTLGVPVAQSQPATNPDAVQEAQLPRAVPEERPEQKKTDHDRSNVFAAPQAPPASNPQMFYPISQTRARSWDLTSTVTRSMPNDPCRRLRRSCARTSRPNRR